MWRCRWLKSFFVEDKDPDIMAINGLETHRAKSSATTVLNNLSSGQTIEQFLPEYSSLSIRSGNLSGSPSACWESL